MNYRECLNHLNDIQKSGVKFGLENVRKVLRSFGHPEAAFPSIHVAGTNGKGSVCAMLTRILAEHGYRVGLYTSPHLVRLEERFRIGDRLIPRRDFCRILTLLKSRVEDLVRSGELALPLTHFEHLTSLAFLYFAERQVDIAVIEVGMGGRFDATNVLRPLVSVITSIARDHMEYLGRTIGKIAFEKAGIIKPGVPVVCGVREGVALQVIKLRAVEKRAPLLKVFKRDEAFRTEKMKYGFRFLFAWEGEEYRFTPALPGEHQGRNAAVAIAAACVVSKTWKKLGKAGIIRGIENAKWEGRLEVVKHRPRVILDGAHNEDGAAAVASYLRDFTPSPRVLVFAVMRDKAIRKMACRLFPLADRIVLTRIPYARAAWPEDIRKQAPEFSGRMELELDPERAVRKALELAGRRGTVAITGSLFLVGVIKKKFRSFSAVELKPENKRF